MTQVRLEPASPRSRVKHSTTELWRSIVNGYKINGIIKPQTGSLFVNQVYNVIDFQFRIFFQGDI